MIRPLALVLVLSAAAFAAPASPRWRAPKTCPHGYWATPTLLVSIDGGKLRRIDRATGKVLPVVASKLKAPHIAAVHGEIVIAVDSKSIAGIDARTGKQRWQKPYAEAQADSNGTALFVRHEARVESVDAQTGKATWSVDVPIGGFALKASRAHVYVRDAAKLLALDPATGKTQWTTELGGTSDGELLVAGDDAIITADDKLAVVDGASGRRTDLGDATWSPEGAPGRVYVVSHSPAQLLAFDAHTGKRVWAAPLLGDESIIERADATGVYVTDDHDLIRAYSPATGKPLWSWGIRSTPYTYSFAGSPPVAYCEGSTLVALDPAAPPAAEGAIHVSGTLSCADCDPPPFSIRVGDTRLQTDAAGHFTARAAGRGALELAVLLGNVWLPLKSLPVPAKKSYELGTLTFEMPGQGD
ncbi:MAG TPA: PQQ-binding-like beta-propeller repeat protein [Kofleriaceae bacterium]|nr:PQQ-binding-like beta-propeller repeat protein [Kofleriaceae bacterium]